MKHGFTLIEILIATAVASILATALFYSYGQINKVFVSTKNYIDRYETIVLLQHQLSKDIAGAFIPAQAVSPHKKKKQPEGPAKKEEAGKQQASAQEPAKQTPAGSGEQEKKIPLLKDPFICKNRDKNMQLLSFITNNATRIFVGKKTGEPKPSTARVVYSLEPDENSSRDISRYILYRQEGSELNLSHYTKSETAIERYPLAHNIKSCTVTFEVVVEQEEKDTKQATKEPKKEIKRFHDWQVGKDEKDVRVQAKLPQKVTFTYVLWDDKQTREDEFTFTVVVAAGYHELPEIEPVKAAPAKPSHDKQAAPADAQKPEEQRKQQLVSGANKVVNNIRTLLGAQRHA